MVLLRHSQPQEESLRNPVKVLFQLKHTKYWMITHVLPLQEIHPNSPAAQAGLIPHTDYILGSDTMVGDDDLYTLIENNNHKELKLFVFNSDSDVCREVSTQSCDPTAGSCYATAGSCDPTAGSCEVTAGSCDPTVGSCDEIMSFTACLLLVQVLLTPNSDWGGEGSLGCGIGYGYLHRIPAQKERKQRDLEMGEGAQEPPTAPPSDGYAEVRIHARWVLPRSCL